MVAPAEPARAEGRLRDVERLTAGWISLVALLVAARFWVLWLAGKERHEGVRLVPWLPLAAYQDIALVAGLAWLTALMLGLTPGPTGRWLIRTLAWLSAFAVAFYGAISAELFRWLKTPLTFRLIAMSDRLRGIRTSLDAAVTHGRLVALLGAPVAVLVLALLMVVLAPRLVRWVNRIASGSRGRVLLGMYLSVSFAATRAAGMDDAVLANPHWALVASLVERDDPFISGQFLSSDLEDFTPPGDRREEVPSLWHGSVTRSNVLLVVLESVGARYLGHYGAPYDNTPELTRLAQCGLTFDRMYASQPYTSNAMAGIFCSLYPWHGWRSLPGRAPDLRIPGLGNVLASQGYRTAMLHTGDMGFDHENEFLYRHGFDEVHDASNLSVLAGDGSPDPSPAPAAWLAQRHVLPDRLLMPAAFRWMDADRSRPFFLTLWTIQTHHPYLVEPSQTQQFTDDPDLNGYLSAIRATDQLLGDLRAALDARGLSESTLVIVLGDHGESFGQHGCRAHSQSLYEEEVRIPLVMAHPTWRVAGARWQVLGQQIDVAPTILDLLGLDIPAEWQGQSLFASDRKARAYLFTAFRHFLFGVVEGDRKYLYDATINRREIYNLRQDPWERINLAGEPSERAAAAELHRRLAGWLHFQNQFLTERMPQP